MSKTKLSEALYLRLTPEDLHLVNKIADLENCSNPEAARKLVALGITAYFEFAPTLRIVRLAPDAERIAALTQKFTQALRNA